MHGWRHGPLLLCCRDPDPDGVQLAMTTNPLGQAAKLVKRLVSHAGENLETHLLAFEVKQNLVEAVQKLYSSNLPGNFSW